jgi:hypothetical protein
LIERLMDDSQNIVIEDTISHYNGQP